MTLSDAQPKTEPARRSPLRPGWGWFLVAVVAAAAAFVGSQTFDLGDPERTAIPMPSPVYTIEASSNGRTASILNLGITPVGVPQVPMPVDVDGDLLPDVTASVNLVDVQGVHNPPNIGEVVAPNIEINRFPLELGTVILGRPSPPLRINVRFDVHDLEGEDDSMHIRFGYDTGEGGSIPGFFQATLQGLQEMYNPLRADISTKGAVVLQNADPLWYQGPLTVIGGFEQGDLNADLGLAFSPFPEEVGVAFAQDDAGAHIGYDHAYKGDVDLDASVVLDNGPDHTEVSTRIERLPHTLDVDIADDPNGGGIELNSESDGRLAHVDARLLGPLAGDVYSAHLSIEDLPSRMAASWSVPEDGPVSASFESSGQGIGAIEADIRNQAGDPQGLPDFVFTEKQFVALHQNAETGGMRIGGRIERLREVHVSSTPEGALDAHVNIGDGELPLEVDGYLDLRGDGDPLIEANAVVSPLPSDVSVSLEPPGEDRETDPLTIRYEAAEAPDIDGTVKIRQPDADSAVCGTAGVLCGDLRIRHVPTVVEARIGDFVNDAGKREARIEVDADGVDKPDLFADVTIGPDPEIPEQIGAKPLVAHAEILGLTETARIRTVEGADDTLERAEFHTCDFVYEDDQCAPGSEDRIGAIEFAISNFLPGERPDDLAPAYAATPNFATAVVRGREGGSSVDFEVTGRMSDIREVTYVNDGAFGVRTNIGGGEPLAAIVDIDGIRFEDAPDPDDTEFYDITGDVLIEPLPQEMAFCLNASGQAIVAPTSTITAPCQQANPFDPDADALEKSPLSVAYDGSSPFDVTVDAELHATGTAGSDDRDDIRVAGHLEVHDIPATIRAHILNPDDEGGGPMLVDVDAPLADTGTEQVDVVLGASVLFADLQCLDPRVPNADHMAICASGRIENLPTHLSLSYDPESASDNFVLDSAGPEQLDLSDLSVSSVTRNDDGDDDPTNDRASVLVAEGDILDLPRRLEGTLSLPAPDDADAPVLVDLTATPAIGTIQAEVRNFIAPDPIPDVPAQRDGLPEPDDLASFIQRGDAFKAGLRVTEIERVGFRNQVDADGTRLDTSVINVDFGRDKNIRGYVDLDADGTDRLIGDVTLVDVPAGLQVCVRGPKSAETAALTAVDPTFCDTNPATDQTEKGALELRMAPGAPALELDVDAFARYATSGGADVLAARVDIDNIPNVVAGTFGDGTADFGGFRLDGTPEGIDRIAVHAASFDITDDGWNLFTRPYQPRFVTRAPFPAPTPTDQHVALRADDTDFEARLRIGSLDPAEPASNLHRVRIGDQPCSRPEAVDYGTGSVPDYGARPDFPLLRTDDGTNHTCIRADFEPVGPNAVDPLDLSAVIDRGGQRIALRDAGLTDIPEFFQMNLADADPIQDVEGEPRLRPHCVGAEETQPTNCVAPMARIDTPGNTTLFGVVEMGTRSDLGLLGGVQAREVLPAGIEPAGWGGETGVRARIGQVPGDRSVVAAGLQLPIPASLTIDQVQSWSQSDRTNQDSYYDANDLHFRYAGRDADGSTIADLGRLSALIHSFTDGSQILLTDDDPALGFEVPGELGLDVFVRDNSGAGRTFIQIDGRNSAQDLDIRARILGGRGEDAIGRMDAKITNVPALQSLAYSPSADPTFRLRAEIMGEGKAPPDPGAEPEEPGEPPKEDECSILFCVKTQVRVDTINAQFDFEPTAGQPARLIEAAIRTDGAKNGVEMRGFSDINGGDPARFLAGAQLSIDPINVFLHAGIPLLGSLDFVMISDLDAAASIGGSYGDIPLLQAWMSSVFDAPPPALQGVGTTAFTMKQNLLRIQMENGSGSESRLGPIMFNVDVMHGEAWALFVKLIGIDFVPPHSTLRIPMLNCNALGLPTGLNEVVAGPNGEADVVAWPFFPAPVGNLHFSGVLAPLVDLVGSFAGPFFCLVDTDQELMTNGSGAKVHPADPIGTAITGSPVPGAAENSAGPPPPPPDPTPAGALVDFPAPSIALPGSIPMCGTFTFDDMTVPAGLTIEVATAPNNLDVRGVTDVADDAFPAACPSGAALRELHLVAAGTVTVNGVIDANAISSTATNATGNGGGGHGLDLFLLDTGEGGAGGNSGSGGPGFGDPSSDLATEAGAAGRTVGAAGGAGGAPGIGGGVVSIMADVLDVNAGGVIRANGSAGTGVGAGTDCFVADTDPDTDGDQTKPNLGRAGGGGGAGGGIVISVADLQNGGVISANGAGGGSGSAGGGGGGGGGVVKVTAALRSGVDPTVGGGAGGGTICPADFGSGGGGEAGSLVMQVAPRSKVDISTDPDFGFWHTTQGNQPLELPYEAAASPVGANDFEVVLCHTVLAQGLLDPDQPLSGQLAGWSGGLGGATLPHFNGFILEQGHPCGTPSGLATPPISGPSVLTIEEVDAARSSGVLTVNSPFPGLSEGYHGFWTVLWKTDVDGNSCFDPEDFEGGVLGIAFDEAHCFAEVVPQSPDIVLGIDNTDPNVRSIAVNGVEITDIDGNITGPQPLNVSGRDLQVTYGADDNFSLVANEQCTPNVVGGTLGGLAECSSGETVTVTEGDGAKTIAIVVTDFAGNSDTFEVDVLLDTTAPTSQGEIVAGSAPAGANGWYQGSPRFRLFSFNDGGGTGPGTPPYEYQIDDGDKRGCPDLNCVVDGSPGHELPGIGRHTFSWTGIDAVGNQLPDDERPSIDVKVDGADPISDLITVPAEPNGANGWFSGATWVSFGAFDQPGASGFDLTPEDPTETDATMGGIFYTHDGGPVVRFDPLEPLGLHAGENEVCWFARDVAGNAEETRCRTFMVDEADPMAQPVTSGGVVGDAEWFTASPNLATQVSDGGSVGSGVSSDTAPAEVLCGQRPVVAPVAPSGTCISIDGAPFMPVGPRAAFELGEGLHEVRVFSTDRAGRRSAISTASYQIDLSDPVAAARTVAPVPSRGRWFRAEPKVVLRAADGDRHGSDVREIRYQMITGTPATCTAGGSSSAYTEPFTVPEGVRAVRYWSVDEAGRVSGCQVLPVAVDLTPPTAKATSANPSIWARLNLLGIPLSKQTTQLRWTLKENLAGSVGEKVKVSVVVYDLLGTPVRILDGGEHTVAPGATLSGATTWDGKRHNLADLVPLGSYYYRVVATDAAGNVTMSGESTIMIIVRIL